VKALLVMLGVLAAAGASATQGPAPQGRAAGPPEEAVVSPGEIQRMFDSYALMQAEQQLQIRDDQFPRFLTRFKSLQDTRRQGLQQHARRLADLRKLLNAPQMDEGAIRDQIKAMDEEDARSQADVKKAYELIDQVLDLQQQAKFRIFEEAMERRKLELVARARQAGRGK
jgi:Spy/CpxP family protein refolding chaperone